MSDTRWRKAESLFHQALSLQEEEREKFVVNACQGDPELYREINSLLSNYHSQDQLLEHAAAAPLTVEAASGLTVRKAREKIGPYEIISLAGRGGMGEVYVARDPRLRRNVAIKILPRSVAGDRGLLERLRKEALAASALNHPNILTIYEFGQQDDFEYIVSEYVEGTSLREHIGRLSTEQAVEYARQIGKALSAAHAAGIIHRDIKPENVMVRADGYIKVLDFGLAKVVDAELATKSLSDRVSTPGTIPGALIGTLNYMSPEQVEGKEADRRSDIWSWGVVLYEMLAGRRPFARETPGGVVAAILGQESKPPSGNEELNRVVSRALEKRVEARYQNMQQALSDLARMSVAAGITSGHAVRRRNWIWPMAAVLVIALAFLGIMLFRSSIWPAPRKLAFSSIEVTRLTTTGEAQVAAISPDGRYVAYAIDEGGKQSLWLRQIATGVTTLVVPPDNAEYSALTFSPDGNFIVYTRSEKDRPLIKSVYQVAALGGTSRKLVTNASWGPVSFSPDGRQIAFLRIQPDRRGISDLIVANADGSGERTVASNLAASGSSSWSPDGRWIAVSTFSPQRLAVVAATGGPIKILTDHNWFLQGASAWLPDSSGLVVPASDPGSLAVQLWRVNYPQGEVSRLTNDPNSYWGASLTGDGKSLITVEGAAPAAIYVVPLEDIEHPLRVAAGAADLDWVLGLDWTRDGRIVYVSKASGNLDLWVMDADGGHARPLVADGVAHPWVAVADDGTAVFSSATAAVSSTLSAVNVDEGSARLLAAENFGGCQDISRDGHWVVYRGDSGNLVRIPVHGGALVLLAEGIQCFTRISPDGKLVAYNYFDAQVQKRRTAVRPLEGGPVLAILDLPQDTMWPGMSLFQWAPDGKALTYSDTKGGVANLWNQPLGGGPPKQLTHFTSDRIFSFAWSRDGKRLAVSRGTRTSDVVLIRSVE